MKLSICIPTYNRATYLANCLQSIIVNKRSSKVDFQICVSDNCSTDETEDVVRHAQVSMPIKYHKNRKNLGIPRNFLNVVEMADGEFVWLIGDDDLLLPCTVEILCDLIGKQPNIDFYFINSYHLTTEYVLSFPQPFDISNLPKKMTLVSSWNHSGEMKFLELVDPKISFDFLGGMFLAVFRRQNWLQHVNVLDRVAISDDRTFSHFDNTFPHVKIFSKAFAQSQAFFHSKPLSVCLMGAREWTPMYPLVRSVRLIEALNQYRKNGLPYTRYLQCKNYALRYFFTDMVLMFLNRDSSGLKYVNPLKLIFANCFYPNCWLSFLYAIVRKIKKLFVK